MAASKPKDKITAERLRQLLHYNPETGRWTWRVHRYRWAAGSRAGGIDGYGYWGIRVEGRQYGAHILAWLYMTGEWPVADVDHRDTNRDNNVWSNLRAATRSQNLQNARPHKDGKSKYKGVSWHSQRGKWLASICKDYKRKSLGLFETEEAAHAAYARASAELHGEFGRVA